MLTAIKLIRPISVISNGLSRLLISTDISRCNYSDLSYVHVPGKVPFVNLTIGGLLDIAQEKYADRESIVDCHLGIRKNFQQHVAEINQFAAGLLSLNLNIGDRIGLWCPNRYEFTIASLAASKAGLILVPLNTAYETPELEYCIEKMKMRAIIANDSFRTRDYYQMLHKVIPELSQHKPGEKVKSKKHPYLDIVIIITEDHLPGAIRYGDVVQAANNEHKTKLEKIQPNIIAEKPAYVMFTSGTTGKPKAAMLSHFTLVNSIYQNRARFNYDPLKPVRVCNPLPLFHMFGAATIHSAIANGNAVILPSMYYNAGATIKSIASEKCDALQGTATMFVDMLDHPDVQKTNCTTLTKILMGGSLCPAPLLQRIKDVWKCETITTSYGATETSGGATATVSDGPWDQIVNNCGPPMDNTEIKIIDSEGRIIPRGDKGEICVRGIKVMTGYWEDEEKTKEVLSSDGWYRTGDLGIMLENGYLQIVDRIKDVIIRGGENVYPKEVEDLLMQHPKISEAHVFGVPDKRLNEEICVWVKCSQNEIMTKDELVKFCKEKISYFKIPRFVRFVNDFPRTLSGKVQKFVMREEEMKDEKSDKLKIDKN